MTLDPTRVPIQGISYDTETFRLLVQDLMGGRHGLFAGGASAQDDAHGVTRPTHLKVTPDGSNRAVVVAAGGFAVHGTEDIIQGSYPSHIETAITVPISAPDATNTRWEIIGVQVLDHNYGGSDPEDDGIFLVVRSGTPASSPSDPSLPDNFLPLARLIVPVGATNFGGGGGQGSITDLRVVTGPSAAVGSIIDFAGSAAPGGWLLCAGQAVSRTTYADLFTVIGTTFGVGNGSTTFNVPDLRGRVGVGLDNMGGSDATRLDVANTLGGSGGEQKHTLTESEMPSHSHRLKFATGSGGGAGVNAPAANTDPGNLQAGYIEATGSGTPHNVMQPYLLLNKIIKV